MTWLTHMGSLPICYPAVPRGHSHAHSHRSSGLCRLLLVSIAAVAVISPGVTRAAASAPSGMSATAVPNPSASRAKALFDAETGAAMARMMASMDVNPTGDVGHDFVAMMVPHHQGAIDMAETELRYGRNEQLLRIAQQIVVEQLQEIAAMRIAVGERVSRNEALLAAGVRAASAAPAPGGVEKSAHSLKAEAPFIADNNSAMERMMNGMTITPSGDVDHDFVAMMVPHHQGAIDMAKAELRHGGYANARLRLIAQEIIVDQMEEITLMRLAMGQALPSSVSSPTDRSSAPTRE
jgi:uncharacterized protein (DUF305 family)